MGEAVEQCGGHLGIAEHAWPFTEGEIGGDDHRGAFVEAADGVEQQIGRRPERTQVAEFIEDDEVQARKSARRPWRLARPSASSRLTRSTVVKKRPRDPARMQLRAMAIARCVLPTPVEAETYCRVSGDRGTNILPVPSSAWLRRFDSGSQPSSGGGGFRDPPARWHSCMGALLDDERGGRRACDLFGSTAAISVFARPPA